MPQLRTAAEIEVMAEGGRILARILHELARAARPGTPTEALDRQARELMRAAGAEPLFLGYRPAGARAPYPASICVSVNDVVVHGLPSRAVFADGDLVKIDAGLRYKGWCLDSAVTVAAGEASPLAWKLMSATAQALREGIAVARAGNTVGDIGAAVARAVARARFSVVEKLTGHGIGRELHESPSVPNFGTEGRGAELVPGMVLAIEPMVAAGSGRVRELDDESFATEDGSPTAHFEHTVAITKEGPRVLTKSGGGEISGGVKSK